MKIEIKDIKENPVNILRRIGYSFQRKEGNPASTRGNDRSSTRGGEMSFIRPLARQGYPRFHIYTSLNDNNLIINIHLDQKKETYGNAGRHHGEYGDDGALKVEIERIRETIG